jgi:hypothetical protein
VLIGGCAPATVHLAKAHRTRMLVARFEALNLPFGFAARDAIRLFNLTRKTRAATCNQVEVSGGEPPPVCVYFVSEALPAGFNEIPVHQTLLSPPALRSSERGYGCQPSDLKNVIGFRLPPTRVALPPRALRESSISVHLSCGLEDPIPDHTEEVCNQERRSDAAQYGQIYTGSRGRAIAGARADRLREFRYRYARHARVALPL